MSRDVLSVVFYAVVFLRIVVFRFQNILSEVYVAKMCTVYTFPDPKMCTVYTFFYFNLICIK